MDDINKLFGIGYAPWWKLPFIAIFGFFGLAILWNEHHKESARFGWRYNPNTDRIILSAYCYVNKRRVSFDIGVIELEKLVALEIKRLTGAYFFYINHRIKCEVSALHTRRFGFHLGPYFGGNKKAPHSMTIEMNKL